jgi:hypothetical protein
MMHRMHKKSQITAFNKSFKTRERHVLWNFLWYIHMLSETQITSSFCNVTQFLLPSHATRQVHTANIERRKGINLCESIKNCLLSGFTSQCLTVSQPESFVSCCIYGPFFDNIFYIFHYCSFLFS